MLKQIDRGIRFLVLGVGMAATLPMAEASVGLDAGTRAPAGPAANSSWPSLSGVEFSEQGTAQSRGAEVIERLSDGRVRMTAPMQNLEALIGPEFTTLRSTDKAGAAGFHWQAQGVGRANSLDPVLWGEVTIAGEVVRVQRASLIEEFRTGTDGIRQDFVLSTRPVGTGELLLELAARDAHLVAVEGRVGQAVAVKLVDDRVLHYHRLLVTDATGAALAARLEVTPSGALHIAVSDEGALYPVRIDPTFSDADWSALGSGTNGDVRALAWDGINGRLYAGGFFSTAGGVAAANIAVWDGSSWSPLGSGMDGSVQALAWDGENGRLYAGGFFATAGGASANNIAVWNGSSWSALGSGTGDGVRSLVWDSSGSRLYVGGVFTTAGGNSANRLAVWNGSVWAALGSGAGNSVSALAWDADNSLLYAGGFFTAAGGVPASNIAAWDGNSWSALGSGVNEQVSALAWDAANLRLYAGGLFTLAGGVSAGFVAAWDGSSWSALGSGMNSNVIDLALDSASGRLFAGGIFSSAGGVSARRIAMWDGISWSALGNGLNSTVWVLAWDSFNSRLYAGGSFTTAGAGPAAGVAQARFGIEAARLVSPLTPVANNASLAPVTDASGRFTVFQSEASNLTGVADGNAAFDIFRVDSETGAAVRVSLDDGSSEIAGDSIEPSVSADGQFVVFVAPDAAVGKVFGEPAKARALRLKGGGNAVFLRSMLTGRTSRIGTALPGGEGTRPQIAPNGMSVVFTGTSVGGEGAQGQQNVFRVPLADMGGTRVPGELRQCVTCKTRTAMGLAAGDSDGPSRNAAVSSDGLTVIYETEAKNQVVAVPSPCQSAPTTEVNLRNMLTGQIRRISPPPGLAPVNCGLRGSSKPTIDWSGQNFAFESDQAIKPGTVPGTNNVFADFAALGLTRLSEQGSGADADGDADQAAISGDGRTVVYVSSSTNIDSSFADTNGRRDVHIKRSGRAGERLSLSTSGVEANGDARRPALNYNATRVVFDSPASNLVAGDTNAVSDIFQRVVPSNFEVVFAADFE